MRTKTDGDYARKAMRSAMLDFVLSGIRAEGTEYAGVIVADNE